MPPEMDQSSIGSMHKPQHQPQQKIAARVVTKHGMRTIVPTRPSKLTIHPVSKLDSILGNFYLHTVLYYESPDLSNKSWDDAAEELNLSLALVLNLFPVLSGRLRVVANGNLGIKSNDSGIRLFEASCDSALSDWLGDPDSSSLRQQVIPDIRITEYNVSALCTIQYTRFRCGGVAIGVSWCHVLADHMSMDLLLKLWAEAHRKGRNMPSKVPRFNLDVKNGQHHHLPEPFDSPGISIKSSPQLETRVFHLSSRSVEKLTQEDAPGASELEALCALVWKAVVRAQSPSSSQSCSRLCLWMNPGEAGQDYFGNAATRFKLVDVNSDDLISQSTEEVSRLIQAGGSSVSNGSSFFAKNVLFCNWSANVPCYDTDFGFSKPVYVDSCATSLFGEGMVTIAPGSQGGRSKCVCVSLDKDAMKRLLQDSSFASAAAAVIPAAPAVSQKINCPSTISAPAA